MFEQAHSWHTSQSFNLLDQDLKTTLGDTSSTEIDREHLSRLHLSSLLSIVKKHGFPRAYYHGR
jgi:hypothetical protein